MIIGKDEEDVGLFAAKGVQAKTEEQKAQRNFFHINYM
tara:strand:- start:373 stop:486 length:114 start_codon:yes stop_codon:yes gene_type:complete